MSSTPAPKPSRTPWIIAGVLGCLVVCLLFAAVGAFGYIMFNSQTTPVVQNVSTSTRPPVALSTATAIPVQPTQVATSTSARAATNTPASTNTAAAKTSATTAPTARVSATTSQFDLVGVPSQTPTLSPFDLVGVPPTVPPTAAPPATKAPPAPTTKPTASPNNYVIAFSKDEGPDPEAKTLWIMNSDGSGAVKLTGNASHPILSRDGNQIAFYHWYDGIRLFNATDPKNPKYTALVGDTFTGGNYGSGDWSHDGRWIAFTKQPGGKGNIVVDVIAPDGTGQRTVQIGESPSWSPDDTMLVFHTCRGSTCGIYKGGVNGGDAIPIVGDDGGLPAWSPDGKWIVYQKDVDGQKQLFLIAPDGSGKKQLTSGAALHVDAAWSPDGAYIFYRSPEGGTWGIWRMNVDGSNRVKLIDNVPPVNWPYERLSISR